MKSNLEIVQTGYDSFKIEDLGSLTDFRPVIFLAGIRYIQKLSALLPSLWQKRKREFPLKKRRRAQKQTLSVAKEEPIILVTNDDGITAPGIHNLVEAVKDLGKIVVVAPDKPQSGMGHAITIGTPLRLHKVNAFGSVEAWQCSGTPVDCVKLAVDKVLHRKPDLCLSGINHGANHSINVIYSGTMSAAVEAAIESIPSVGFSLLDYNIEADFSGSRKYVRIIVQKLLQKKQEKHMVLNVNIPALPA